MDGRERWACLWDNLDYVTCVLDTINTCFDCNPPHTHTRPRPHKQTAVADGCENYTSSEWAWYWEYTWGTHGHKGATRCTVGKQTGVCDVTGQCYAYVTPQDVAEELYAIYKDFETGNILAPTYLDTQRGWGYIGYRWGGGTRPRLSFWSAVKCTRKQTTPKPATIPFAGTTRCCSSTARASFGTSCSRRCGVPGLS
jgi:hypothetical protein